MPVDFEQFGISSWNFCGDFFDFDAKTNYLPKIPYDFRFTLVGVKITLFIVPDLQSLRNLAPPIRKNLV